MPQRLASLSLDLDNKWSYMKTHGDDGWEAFPSYLDVVVPRVLDFLKQRGLKITFFVVGQDAALPENAKALRSLADAGHEIGNHSFHHEPWLHLYSPEQIEEELQRAEEAIEAVTGQLPTGFRGPGFSFSQQLLQTLAKRGYAYDCSTFPTFLGPLARLYYFFTSDLTPEEKADRKQLFGKLSEGFRSLKPYHWPDIQPELLEIPVTTMPLFKVPIHVSYLLYLGQYSQTLAMAYFRMALKLSQLFRVEPSLLLHPLDFMGKEDDSDLAFFPAMGRSATEKIALVGKAVDLLASRWNVVPMREHAEAILTRRSIDKSSHPVKLPSTAEAASP